MSLPRACETRTGSLPCLGVARVDVASLLRVCFYICRGYFRAWLLQFKEFAHSEAGRGGGWGDRSPAATAPRAGRAGGLRARRSPRCGSSVLPEVRARGSGLHAQQAQGRRRVLPPARGPGCSQPGRHKCGKDRQCGGTSFRTPSRIVLGRRGPLGSGW